MSTCPLCLRDDATAPFYEDRQRPYLRCAHCALVHVPRRYCVSPQAEKRRYDLHRNDPEDAGYVAFLERLAAPLASRLRPGAEGLDFGSGPVPVLSSLLTARGFRMSQYDRFFACRPEALARTYDFVACSETVEHFHDPAGEWALLFALIRPAGWLGVMTSLLTPDVTFSRWSYRTDETHICFYAPETLAWLAQRHGATLHVLGASVALFECGANPRLDFQRRPPLEPLSPSC